MIARRRRRRRRVGGDPAAFLKTRYRVNEILSSLMLVYVALQLLNYLVTGPWKDPNGHNFPQTAPFTPSQTLPHTICSARRSRRASIIAFALALVFWVVMARSEFGLGIRVVGDAPKAARYAGYRRQRMVWQTLLISGGMAGLAGVLEAATQAGQLNLGFPSGYGFTAIIVSFLGRLHPIGVVLAGIVLAVSYVGGQVAQTVVHVPSATAGIFQATMLFLILASDVLVQAAHPHRSGPSRRKRRRSRGARHERRFSHPGDRSRSSTSRRRSCSPRPANWWSRRAACSISASRA